MCRRPRRHGTRRTRGTRRAPKPKKTKTLSPAHGTAPENLALDPDIAARVKAELLPLIRQTRSDRQVLRDRWLRYYRIWSLRHDIQGYKGRTNTYFPIGRRWIEQWVTRIKRDLFPDSDWFACRALRQDFEDRIPAKVALQKYWMRRYMRLRRHSLPFLRQLVMYGTSPVRNVWRCIEHMQPALRDVLEDDGTPSGQTIQEVEKVADFLGPTFEPVDLFAFYVWPVTASRVDSADAGLRGSLRLSEPRRDARRAAARPGQPESRERLRRAGRAARALRLGHLSRVGPARAVRSTTRSPSGWLTRGSPPRSTRIFRRRSGRSTSPNARGPPTSRATGSSATSLRSAPTPSFLRVQRRPFWHGGTQWLCGRFVEVAEEFYGRGLPEVFDYLQYFVNDLGNQSGDAFVWSTNPIAVIDIGAVQDPTSLRMTPGAKWLANPAGVQFTSPPQGVAQAGLRSRAGLHGHGGQSGGADAGAADGARAAVGPAGFRRARRAARR